jgi:hypothetical protein
VNHKASCRSIGMWDSRLLLPYFTCYIRSLVYLCSLLCFTLSTGLEWEETMEMQSHSPCLWIPPILATFVICSKYSVRFCLFMSKLLHFIQWNLKWFRCDLSRTKSKLLTQTNKDERKSCDAVSSRLATIIARGGGASRLFLRHMLFIFHALASKL